MKTDDLKIIAQFLDKNFREFRSFLESKKLDHSETDAISERLEEEVNTGDKQEVKKTKVKTDDLPSVGELNEWVELIKDFRQWMLLNFPKDFSKDKFVYTRDIVDVAKKKLKLSLNKH